jgi:hypothetical protein
MKTDQSNDQPRHSECSAALLASYMGQEWLPFGVGLNKHQQKNKKQIQLLKKARVVRRGWYYHGRD